MSPQTTTYYKSATQSTRFNAETGELLHVTSQDDNTIISVQTITVTQREAMVMALTATNVASTPEVFNDQLATIKSLVANL